MNDLDSFYLKAMCQKHDGDYQVIMNYIEVFTDLLQDIHPNSPNLIVRTYTPEEACTASFKIFIQYMLHQFRTLIFKTIKEDGSVQLSLYLNLY